MDNLIKDLAIEPFKIGNTEINHLRIEISHDKGGHSWGTGEWRPCGVRADIKPIEKKDHKSLLTLLRQAVDDFSAITIPDDNIPVIGVVGEIYIKYNYLIA